jgi:hypothetical protein
MSPDVLAEDLYELLTLRVLVRSEHLEIAEALRWHLEDFRSDVRGGSDVLVEVTAERGDRLRYVRDGVQRRLGPPRRILRHALWDIHQLVVDRVPSFLFLHAGAVVRNGGALLLPAAMEVGKSSLTATLIQRGYGYLSDEYGALKLDTGEAHPFPKRITLAPDVLHYLPGLEERLHDRHGLSGQLTDRYAGPADLGGSIGAPAPVRRVVFPSIIREGPPHLTPLTPAAAVAELSRRCLNLFRYGREGLDLLVSVARSADSFLLEGGTPQERAGLIDGA